MNGRTPPYPGRDLNSWASQIYEFLASQANVTQRVEPTPVLLAHQTASGQERATVNGLLIYDPVAKRPLLSMDGAFYPVALIIDAAAGGGANLGYIAATRTVTSDSGTDAVITLVDAIDPGLMSSADKTKLDNIAATVQAYTLDVFANPVAVMDFNQQQTLQFVLENRTSDPASPVSGQIWLRTDL